VARPRLRNCHITHLLLETEWLDRTRASYWKVPGLNLCPKTGYPVKTFLLFPQFLQVNAEIVP
jgi:hypothetical protein